MSKPSVLERLNHYVISGKGKILDLSGCSSEDGFVKFASLPATVMSATVTSHMNYFFNPEGTCVHTFVGTFCCVCLCAYTNSMHVYMYNEILLIRPPLGPTMGDPINETLINADIKGSGPINKVVFSKAMSIRYNGNLTVVYAIPQTDLTYV